MEEIPYLQGMDTENLKMHSRRLRHFYPYLKLTANQVERIVAFEEQPSVLREVKEIFSYWEEWEYTLDEFRKILTREQFKLHLREQRKAMLVYEKQLKQGDAEKVKELAHEEEYTNWLRDEFVPNLQKEMMNEGILLVLQRDKIAYLRNEYARFLDREHYNVLVRHYRHSRRLQPNTLRMAQLRLERKRLFPDHATFLREADEAVRSVAAFLRDHYRVLAYRSISFFQAKSAEINKQWEDLRVKHTGERGIQGWHSGITPKDTLPIEEDWMLSLLLMGPVS